ncbi:MAG: UDP-glucuronate 4-epimerase 4 [Chlamydiia bacterium]|nr:UDP-glucuronate 4-epimerase 4 [Chlamydiia bacterium]
MSKQKIFITGAAGFIGSHLAHYLHDRGADVVGLDNFNDYYTPKLKRDRERRLREKGILIYEQDLSDRERLECIIDKEAPTHVVHLAAQAGVRYSLTHPELYIRSNIDGFLHLLEACKKNPHVPIVYASSSSVYGRNEKVPFSIDDATDSPANIYGMTKKANELMAYAYHHLYKIPLVGLRFFTVYGPWGRPDMAYYSFTKAIFEGTPINLYNFGEMRRDFTYIDDIVEGISKSLEIDTGNHIFNLGNNRPESLHTFVTLIEEAVGKKAATNLLPMPVGEIVETYADIEASRRLLGYEPKTSLATGIRRFVDWYREYSSTAIPN